MYDFTAIEQEIRDSGFSQEYQDFYLRYLDNLRIATYLTPEQLERKITVLLTAIQSNKEAQYFNRPEIILRDALLQSGSDLLEYTATVGKGIKGALGFLTNPVVLVILVLVALGALGYFKLGVGKSVV